MSSWDNWAHDMDQAKRRTTAQNRAIVELLMSYDDDEAYYSDVPPEGGLVTVGIVGGFEWAIDREGLVTLKVDADMDDA